MCGEQRTTCETLLLFHYMGSWDVTQVTTPGCKRLYSLSHLTSPTLQPITLFLCLHFLTFWLWYIWRSSLVMCIWDSKCFVCVYDHSFLWLGKIFTIISLNKCCGYRLNLSYLWCTVESRIWSLKCLLSQTFPPAWNSFFWLASSVDDAFHFVFIWLIDSSSYLHHFVRFFFSLIFPLHIFKCLLQILNHFMDIDPS